MSITITTDIFCDICSTWDDSITVSGVSTTQIRLARQKAKQKGWIIEKCDGETIDICPLCKIYKDN